MRGTRLRKTQKHVKLTAGHKFDMLEGMAALLVHRATVSQSSHHVFKYPKIFLIKVNIVDAQTMVLYFVSYTNSIRRYALIFFSL